MIQDPAKRSRIQSTLKIIILATIPCYLLGMIVLWVGDRTGSSRTPTTTPTIELTFVMQTPTLPEPGTSVPTLTSSPTGTARFTATITPTFFLPTSTPSMTPSPTSTSTPEEETPTPTLTPEDTPTENPPIFFTPTEEPTTPTP